MFGNHALPRVEWREGDMRAFGLDHLQAGAASNQHRNAKAGTGAYDAYNALIGCGFCGPMDMDKLFGPQRRDAVSHRSEIIENMRLSNA